jgi:hypothetical protein
MMFPVHSYMPEHDNGEPIRWKVCVVLKTGEVETIFVEEIDELQELVEHGPCWDTELDYIAITYNK